MTNDEIKIALRKRCPIIHNYKYRQTKIKYLYARAWRVTVDRYTGAFVSELELVDRTGRSITIAPADECEMLEGAER